VANATHDQEFTMRFSPSSPLFALFFSPAFSALVPDFQTRCKSLGNSLNVKGYNNITVTRAQYLTKNTTLDQTSEGVNATCQVLGIPPMPVNLCRLALHIPTSDSSGIVEEVWLPEEWSGRFLSTGNGGLGGCKFTFIPTKVLRCSCGTGIGYPDMAFAASYGFATVGNNNGHNGSSGGAFLNQPQVFEDYAWRAIYTATVVGKEVTKQLYGKAHKKSYFFGCSSGGRQGFKAVQQNPELFDGVIVGAPAIGFTGVFAHFGQFLKTFGISVDALKVPIEKWMSVQQETLRQCDHLDGAVDGIVEDTRRCKPDLSKLLCDHYEAPSTCLTRAELALVEGFFKPFVVDGEYIYPAATHNGDEVFHIQSLLDGNPLTWAIEWPRNVIFSNASFDFKDWTLQDAVVAKKLNPSFVDTWEGDLSKFRNRGGKVLHWHGEADQYLNIDQSDRYYAHVSKTMRSSPKELDEFYRYFRISGFNHCYGGNGANNFGQGGVIPAPSDEPDDNTLKRIVAWVEKGEAPEILRGTKFVNDDKSKGVAFTRKHCKFPARNVYTGKGNGTDESGWHCIN
jgi:feruloyl esterase